MNKKDAQTYWKVYDKINALIQRMQPTRFRQESFKTTDEFEKQLNLIPDYNLYVKSGVLFREWIAKARVGIFKKTEDLSIFVSEGLDTTGTRTVVYFDLGKVEEYFRKNPDEFADVLNKTEQQMANKTAYNKLVSEMGDKELPIDVKAA